MNIAKKDNLYLIAKVEEGGKSLLTLHLDEDQQYRWYLENEALDLSASTLEEACKLARERFRHSHFRLLSCGHKFTLPERDEHGTPANYQEMVKSLRSMNGVFFDERLGHVCIVKEIPTALVLLSFCINSLVN